MISEPDNTFDEDVTDNAPPTSDDDTANELTYYDPDDDLDNDDADTSDTPDDEGEAEPEATDVATEAVAAYAEDTAVVKLSDGTEMPVAELKNGYLRQSDFTRKTQEVANERKTVQADVERMQRITTAFVDHLTALVPDPPSPSLAMTDPAKYVSQKAQHEAAMGQVQKLIEMGSVSKEVGAAMSGAANQRQIQEANARLVEMFPEAASGKGREAFFNGVQSAANDLGFSNDDLTAVRDPRVFALAHWAAKGMAAEKAKAAAKAKVAAAPPATPRKPGQGARQANGNAEAMRRLTRSGSIHDAVKIDWD